MMYKLKLKKVIYRKDERVKETEKHRKKRKEKNPNGKPNYTHASDTLFGKEVSH